MDRISVKAQDISLRGGDSAKPAKQTGEASDDFRKLLQGQREDSKEVPKDAKAEKKAEDVKEPKKEEKANVEDAKEAEGKEEKTQAEGLLAAYQMSQNFRPEVIQAEPEAVAQTETQAALAIPEAELMPTEAAQTAQTQTAGQSQTQAQAAQIQAEPETVAEDKAEGPVKEPQLAVKPEAETQAAPVQQKADTSGSQKEETKPEQNMAEQAAQAQSPEPAHKAGVQEAKMEEPVKVYAQQPEELPEKVTEQLMAKISEGVKEFEIHIEPENLGKIAVKILYQGGQAVVSILCSEKRALDMLGRNAGEIGQIIDRNLGGTTTIVVEKPESDYLDQARDDSRQGGENGGQEQKKDGKKEQSAEDAEQFLQKLRLGLAG